MGAELLSLYAVGVFAPVVIACVKLTVGTFPAEEGLKAEAILEPLPSVATSNSTVYLPSAFKV
jgi:hypothetical protein